MGSSILIMMSGSPRELASELVVLGQPHSASVSVFTFINVDRFSNGRPPLTNLATPVDKNINAGDS